MMSDLHFSAPCYDVSTETIEGQKRLRRVAKACKNCGQRVQKSVFECVVDPAQWTRLRQNLINEVNLDEDSLRFYFMGANWQNKIEHAGVKTSYDPEGPLVI